MRPPRAARSGREWFVVRTRVRSEGFVAAQAEAFGAEVYLPRIAIGRDWRSAEHTDLTEPLFPGYLFVRLDLAEHFRRISRSPGVRGFLSFGDDRPVPVEADIIAGLQERSPGGVFRPRDPFRPGAAVQVLSGPLAGLLGIVDRPLTGSGRVSVLLRILARQTRVEMAREALAIA